MQNIEARKKVLLPDEIRKQLPKLYETEELGYFSLHELATIRGRLGLPIERDVTFEPETLENLKNN